MRPCCAPLLCAPLLYRSNVTLAANRGLAKLRELAVAFDATAILENKIMRYDRSALRDALLEFLLHGPAVQVGAADGEGGEEGEEEYVFQEDLE